VLLVGDQALLPRHRVEEADDDEEEEDDDELCRGRCGASGESEGASGDSPALAKKMRNISPWVETTS
jgi:hypothetical protein